MSDEPRKRKSLFVKPHPLEALSLVAIFISVVLFLRSVLNMFGIPYGLDFGEGYLANMSFEMVTGSNPYNSLDQPPWIVSSYPPLYPFINGLIMILIGPSLLPGRFLAVISFIGIAFGMIVLLRRLNINPTMAVIAAGLLFVFPWGFRWAQVVRVDTLGIFLSILGVYWWIRSDKTSDTIIAAIFLTLAVLTKHSLLAAPIACVIYGLLAKDRRSVLLLLLLGILIAGSYSLINAFTGGGFFLHLFDYTANAWFIDRFTAGLGEYVGATWILQIVAVASLITPGVTSEHRRLIGWYWLLSQGTLIAYGFEGSDTNYYIEPLITTALLASFSFNHLVDQRKTDNEPGQTLVNPRTLAYAIIFVVIILGRFMNPIDFKLHRVENNDMFQNGQWLIRMAHDVPGDVLSEDAGFTFLAGKPVIFQPYIMSLLQRTGKWDQTEFVSTIQNTAYSMIILRVDLSDPYNTEIRGGAWEMAGFDRWTKEMESAIIENYELYGAVDVGAPANLWYVYFPKGPGEDPYSDLPSPYTLLQQN